MIRHLKTAMAAETRRDDDSRVRGIVEDILGDIEKRGDAAVRELSIKFDGWNRDDYRLTEREKQACLDELSPQDVHDINFAQTQVRNFAQIQRDSMVDVEVETLPGVCTGP